MQPPAEPPPEAAGGPSASDHRPLGPPGRRARDRSDDAAEPSVPESGPAPTAGPGRLLRPVRRVTHAQGMGNSGLSRLLELNAFNAAGEAAMAIGLAGTLFFAVPSEEARWQIVLTLLLTMLPFAVMAPLIGPLLDRFGHGRRWAIGATLAARAFLTWSLADVVADDSLWLFPLALGCLVAGRAHGIARAAAVPRLLPTGMELVTANSRIYLAGIAGTATGGAIGGAVAFFGASWPLRVATVLYAIGTVLAILLPGRADSPATGEQRIRLGELGRTLRGMPPSLVIGLRANAAFRAFTGFLIMFMAFLLREQPLSGVPLGLQIGVVAGAAAGGNLLGSGLGALATSGKGGRQASSRPETVLQLLLAVAAVGAALCALFYGLIAIAVIGLIAGLAQQLGRLMLDALIGNEVPEAFRTSVFARSETVQQVSWVAGGMVGLVLPLNPHLALAVCAVGMLGGLIAVRRVVVKSRGR